MQGRKKINKVIRTLDNDPRYIGLEDYVMFEDTYISYLDDYSINNNTDEKYEILDVQEVKEYTMQSFPPTLKQNQKTYSIVKLNKTVNIGDEFVLYLENRYC